MPQLHGRDAEKKWRKLAGGEVTSGKDGNGITSAVLNDDYTLTLTFTDGTEYTTPSIRGATGETPEVTVLRSDSSDGVGRGFAIVTFTLGGESQSFTVWDGYPGADGRPGVGIKSIEKISTDGLVDTYKINYTPISGGGASVDPTYFSVTNGKDYVPTEADKTAIAQEAAKLVDAPVTSVNGKTGDVKIGASEVGALPASTKIPSKTSDLTNDSGFVADSQVYVKDETYSQTEVDGLIDALSKRLEAVADSDDVTLDQLSEIVAYIKANKSLIDSITTSKVSISDIVDNLTTGDSKKPLSAAQGKALKALYDAIPAWAKESSKPSYSKSDVGLGNVDNVRQYSASNPPPYPVTSVNEKTGAVTLGAADVGAATAEQFGQLSKEIADLEIKSVKTVNGTAPDGNGNVDVIANIETPKIVASVAEMTDPTKHYVLDGYIWYNKTVVTEDETIVTNPNQFVPSTATLSSRLSGSSGSITVGSNAYGSFTTDFIKLPKYGETTPYNVRLNWELPYHDDNKVVFYDSNKNRIGHNFISNSTTSTATQNATISGGKTTVDIKTLCRTSNGLIPADTADVAYVKFQLYVSSDTSTALTATDIANLEITFDAAEETEIIEGTTTQEWLNSGISYAPTFKTDLIGVLGEDNVIYLSDNLPSGTYTLKYGDDNYATVGTISK